jgi:hypothetical protein
MWSAIDSGFWIPWFTHPVRLLVLSRSSVWKKPNTPVWQSAGRAGAVPLELSEVAVMFDEEMRSGREGVGRVRTARQVVTGCSSRYISVLYKLVQRGAFCM